jgi:hypothetical protein
MKSCEANDLFGKLQPEMPEEKQPFLHEPTGELSPLFALCKNFVYSDLVEDFWGSVDEHITLAMSMPGFHYDKQDVATLERMIPLLYSQFKQAPQSVEESARHYIRMLRQRIQ